MCKPQKVAAAKITTVAHFYTTHCFDMRGDNASPDRSRVGILTSFSNSQDDTFITLSPPAIPRKSDRRTHRMPIKKVVLKAQRQPSRRSYTGNADTNAKSKRHSHFAITEDPTIPSPSKPAHNKRFKVASLRDLGHDDEPFLPCTTTASSSATCTQTTNATHLPDNTVENESSMQLPITKEETLPSETKASRIVRVDSSDNDTPDNGPAEELVHGITSSMARIVIVANEEKEDASYPTNKTCKIKASHRFSVWSVVDSSANELTTNSRASEWRS